MRVGFAMDGEVAIATFAGSDRGRWGDRSCAMFFTSVTSKPHLSAQPAT